MDNNGNRRIEDVDIMELKALIYDESIKISQSQSKIKIFQDELNRRMSVKLEQNKLKE